MYELTIERETPIPVSSKEQIASEISFSGAF
jgi:hypothetical protein